MSETPLDAFARELAADVDQAVQADTAEPYSEIQFTRLILDELAWTSPTRDAHRGSGSDKVVLRERLDLRWR